MLFFHSLYFLSLTFVLLLFANCSPAVDSADNAPEATSLTYRPAVPGVRGLISSGHPLASMAGMRVLLKGGNAIDASIAVLATLNVVRPQMSGAGGNGFFTIYDKASGKIYSLNATGAAPHGLEASRVTDEDLHRGIQAGVVPGLLGGWIAALDRFGTMSLTELLEPAIEYATNGHPIEKSVTEAIRDSQEIFKKFASSRSVFLPNGQIPKPNTYFRMPHLAATFKKLTETEQYALRQGKSRSKALQDVFDRFYRGDIAREIVAFYEKHGGLFTADDLASYKPIWAEPLHTNYRGYDVYSSPSTSRGGFEVTMQLNCIESFDVKSLGHNSAKLLHLVGECIKVVKSDVYHYTADPKSTEMPVAGMLSEDYAAQRRKLINRQTASPFPHAGSPLRVSDVAAAARISRVHFSEHVDPDGHTDSFSIVDEEGNAVACTPTHGSSFGTSVVVGNTGLTFNNGTRIGSTAPYADHVNYARGGQIPILNNSPIIVLKNGQFVLAIGTPGGETIGQTQFQALLNILDFGMSIQEAVAAPRIALYAEPNFYKPGASITMRVEERIPEAITEELETMGHSVQRIDGYSLGSMQGVLADLESGTLAAGADPRRVAYAVGW